MSCGRCRKANPAVSLIPLAVLCKCNLCGKEAATIPGARCLECLTYHGEKSVAIMVPQDGRNIPLKQGLVIPNTAAALLGMIDKE